MPYCVTVNFGVVEKEQLEICFHSAVQGKKIEILEENPKVAFTAVSTYEPKIGETPCKWSAKYESVYGDGIAEIVDGDEKKIYFDAIMINAGAQGELLYDAQSINNTKLIKIKINEISGKSNV